MNFSSTVRRTDNGWSHAPGLFDAALANEWVHRVEHATFFGTALLFWRAILLARTGRRIGPTLAASFATLMHGGLLGALLTMAPLPLYAWYHDHAELWGMSQIEDQQLAGLLMWVPMGGVYFAACVFLASRLLLTGAPENVSRDRMLAARNLKTE